jgi:exodeoxyribonuclease VII small subunit
MPQGSQAERRDSFEKNLERLEAIVSQLEAVDLPLEKALQLYEEGMQLSAACQKQLDEAEGRVEILKKRASGKMEAQPFSVEDENAK